MSIGALKICVFYDSVLLYHEFQILSSRGFMI